MTAPTHNPFDEIHWASCLRENLTSSSYGEGLETGHRAPRQSLTRQLFFRWIKMHLRVKAFFGISENASQVANLDRRVGLRARRHHQEATQPISQPVRNATDFEPQPVRENPARYSASAYSDELRIGSRRQTVDSSLKTLGQAWFKIIFSCVRKAPAEDCAVKSSATRRCHMPLLIARK
jgi:hypothetical protein